MTLPVMPATFLQGGAGLVPNQGASDDLKSFIAALRLHAPKRISLTVGEADLTAGATTQSLNLGAALPDGAMVIAHSIRVPTPFSGGGITDMKVAIGTAGDDDSILASADVDAATDGMASTYTLGIAPFKFFATGAQLLAKFTSAGANVSAATAGQCIIDLLYTEASP